MIIELKHNSENKKKPANKKRFFIIGGAALAVCIAVGVMLFFAFNCASNPLLPSDSRIKADLAFDKSVSQIEIGKKTYTFRIKDFEKKKTQCKPDGDNPESFDVWVTISRASEIYGIKPVDYKVSYEKLGGKLKYKCAKALSDKIVFTALAGADKDDAMKIVRETYKKAKFKSQKTDLQNGDDEITFVVDDKEYEGSAVAVYEFSSSKGWVYKKLDDRNVSFRKGVTHKENGLYTNSNIKNILFLGIDSNDGSGRSDVMMLISIDNNTGKIKQTSFMRDNWFEIPGYGKDKLNAAYAYGGEKLTVRTIEDTFGIKIDNYAAVNFSTFKHIINELGGIDVDITSDEAGYINWQINRNGQAGSVGTVSESGGVTHLNGQQALWLCRDRGGEGFSGDDFVRTARQRRVIQALVDTYKGYTPAKVLSTINALKGSVRTDLSVSDLKWFAERSAKFFTYSFSERCVPQDGEWQSGTSDGGAWIIQLNDFSKLKSDVQKRIYEDLK